MQRNVFYVSPPMISIMKQINLLTSTDASVLITGGTGTGKDHIPHIIHSLSARRKHLFVKINYAALSPPLAGTQSS